MRQVFSGVNLAGPLQYKITLKVHPIVNETNVTELKRAAPLQYKITLKVQPVVNETGIIRASSSRAFSI